MHIILVILLHLLAGIIDVLEVILIDYIFVFLIIMDQIYIQEHNLIIPMITIIIVLQMLSLQKMA